MLFPNRMHAGLRDGSITLVAEGAISDDDARRADDADAAALRAELKWSSGITVYRIEFHREEPTAPPPPDLDGAVRAGDPAADLGRERLEFKADVRKLKRLGLTESLEIGYRLSTRGRAYLDAT